MHLWKRESEEENQAFLKESGGSEDVTTLSREDRKARWRGYVRLLLELAMAFTIIMLLFFPPYEKCQRLRRSPVPNFPRKIYTFHNDPKYTREDMFMNESLTLHTLHNWIELSSASRGYVVIDDASRYDLPVPTDVALDRFRDGKGYMMSVFHQLHCLSYLAEHFQQGYGGVELTEEVAHHTAHCFNYVRQGITCNADITLEGKTDAGPGEGSEHECVDYDALREWANDHSAYRWREALLPEESIL